MASNGIISVKCKIASDKFDFLNNDIRQSVADGVYNTMVEAKQIVGAYTPYDMNHKHGGPHLNEPEIHRYDNGTVSMQWRANNNGFYYADIQNSDWTLNHPNGGRAGFIDDAKQIIQENTPEAITKMMHSRGW